MKIKYNKLVVLSVPGAAEQWVSAGEPAGDDPLLGHAGAAVRGRPGVHAGDAAAQRQYHRGGRAHALQVTHEDK